jgi:nicotinamidase-related amidase
VTGDDRQSDRALVVLDMTEGGCAEVPAARELVRYIRGELRYFRERGRPVIFVATTGGGSVLPELTPRTGEPVVEKSAPSAFFATNLDELLPDSVRRLTLVGVESTGSVLLTAADAMARGYQVVVPEPCAAARDADDHAFAMRLIRDVWKPTHEGPAMPLSDEGRAISDEGAAVP